MTYYVYDVRKEIFVKDKENPNRKATLTEKDKNYTQTLLDMVGGSSLLFIRKDEVDDDIAVCDYTSRLNTYFGGVNPND